MKGANCNSAHWYSDTPGSGPVHNFPTPAAVSRRRECNGRSYSTASHPILHSARLKSWTAPRRFSCAHAHMVNKMADVDTAAENKQFFVSQFLL